MQSWNPMKEAFDDPEFNRYPAGLGRDLSENVKNIDLYVENIPPTLGQEGLYNLFAEYGRVLKARIITSNKSNHPGLIGFVTMESMVDAEAAMSKIDQRKIGQRFVLRVKLAYSKEERERRKKIKQNSGEFSNPSTDFDDTSSVKSFSKPIHRVSDQDKADWNRKSDNNTESLVIGRGSKRHIQNDEPIDTRNDDHFEVTSFGRGRGIVYHEKTTQKDMKGHLFNMKLNNDTSLTSRKIPFTQMEKLHNSLSSDNLKSSIPDKKLCNYCSKNGCSNLCSICKQYYCSVECQRKDWPRHKNICGYLGTNLNELHSLEGNFSEDGDESAPKTKPNQNYILNSEKIAKKKGKDKNKTAHFDKKQKENESEGRADEKSHYQKIEGKNNLGKLMDFQTISSSEEKTNNLSDFEKTDYFKDIKVALPVGSQVQAMLTYFKSPSEFWISLEEQLMDFTELTQVLNEELENCTSTKLIKPLVGYIYGAKYEGEWCRVRIDDVADDEATVYCIDFGNTERIKIGGLRQLTPEMFQLPPQAIACCLNKVMPKKSTLWGTQECEVLCGWLGPPMSKFFMCKVVDTKGVLHDVKISLDDEDLSEKLIQNGLAEVANVQPQPKLSELVKDKKRFMVSDIKSEKHLLRIGDRLKVMITDVESATKFNVIKIEAYKTLSQINALLSLEYNHKTPPYRPVKGELVVAQFPGDTSWYRCEVTEVKDDSYHVYCIDYGTQGLLKEDSVHYVKSSKLAEFPSLALRCSLFECDSFDGVSEDCMRKEFDLLHKDFADSKGVLSMVVKQKDVLMVDFLSELKESFSQVLNKKLKQITLKSESKQQKHSLTIVPNSSSNLKDATKSEVSHLCDETLLLGDITKVNICFILSTGQFYVHLVSKKNSFLNMMKEMNKSIQSAPLMSAPCVGSLVAVQYSLDGLWYRGKVKSIQGHECEVIFLDYANTERAQIDSLRELSSDFTQVPVQAIRCRLNIRSQPTKEADDKFKKFLENETVYIKAVKLTQESYSVNIAVPDHIRLDFLKDMDINQPSFEQEITSIDFTVNTVVKVQCVVMDSPLRFYVQVTEHVSSLLETTQKLNKRLISQPEPLTSVFAGCFAAAKSTSDEEENWYRVTVERITGDKCIAHFVDYGISEQISTSDLRMLSDEDYKLPACAIACRLKGCQMNYSNTYSSCLTMGPNLIESIKILGKEEDYFIVDVLDCVGQCITNKFVSENSPPTFKKSTSSLPVKDYLTQLKQQKLPKTDQHIPAFVTHINSYHDLFISLRDETAVSNFLKLMLKLNVKIETGKPLRNPVLGQVCAAKFSQDGDWYRARIIELMELKKSVKVQFVDYGNCEEVILSDIRTLEDEFFTEPAQAIPCCIAGFESSENVTRKKKTSEKLKVNLPYNIKVIKKLDEKYVITVENEYGESVIENRTGAVHKSSAPQSSDLLLESPHEKEFTVIFCHINGLNDFYCQKIDKQALSDLQSLSEDLKKDLSKLGKMKSIEPLVGCVYMSEFQGSWYRCVVQEIKGSKVVIRYIDYGNTEVKRTDELYPLSPERMLLPVRLIKCKLHGVEPVNSTMTDARLQNYLEILATQQPFLIIHKEVDDTFQVSIYIIQDDIKINVADDLVSNGLAKRIFETTEDVKENEAEKQQLSLFKNDDTDEEEVNEEELEIQIKILELQKKLAISKQRKNKKN